MASRKHQVFMGDEHGGQMGGTSLPDQETEEKMESELVLGGAWARAVLAGKGVFPREPVPYLSAALDQTTKPCSALRCQG